VGTVSLIFGVIFLFLGLHVAFNIEENSVGYFIFGAGMWGVGALYILKFYRDRIKEKNS